MSANENYLLNNSGWRRQEEGGRKGLWKSGCYGDRGRWGQSKDAGKGREVKVTWGQGQMQGTLFCKAETLLGSREGWGIPLDPSDLDLNLKLVLMKQKNQSLATLPHSPPHRGSCQRLWVAM